MSSLGRVLRPLLLALVPLSGGAASSPDAEPVLVAARLLARQQKFVGELRPLRVVRTSAATYVRFDQYVDGLPVVDGGAVVRIDAAGATALDARLVGAVPPASAFAATRGRREVILNRHGGAVRASEIIGGTPAMPVASYVGGDGRVLETRPLFFTSGGGPAAVFLSNPVTRLADPSLQDQDDHAAAVPGAAYSTVDLVSSAGDHLRNAFVEIVDRQLPSNAAARPDTSLVFTRDDPRFEETMLFHHVTGSLDYIDELGVEVSRLFASPLEIDAHAGEDDLSTYVAVPAGSGRLLFGDGGVDDAEDPDVVHHELMHALHDRIAPGALGGRSGSEARALAEGFADYWAMSLGYFESATRGRDPRCVGDWDVRCGNAPSRGCRYPAGADCLRRTDSRKTMADFVRNDVSGVEHRNGEIWASLLQQVFDDFVTKPDDIAAKRGIDRLVIETLFGIAPSPTFASVVVRMLDVDRRLFDGAHASSICRAATARGVIAASGCLPPPSLTRVVAPDRDLAIPDSGELVVSLGLSDERIIARVVVNVAIAHDRRADLRLELIAPDGSVVLLQEPSVSDAGTLLEVSYGLDTAPVESLARLAGRRAAGTWSLRITDTASKDTGRLLRWSLDFEFTEPVLPDDRLMRVRLPLFDGRTVVEVVSSADRDELLLVRDRDGAESSALVPARAAVAIDDPAAAFRRSLSGQASLWADPASLTIRGQLVRRRHDGGFVGAGLMPLGLNELTRRFDGELHLFLPPGVEPVIRTISGELVSTEMKFFDAAGNPLPDPLRAVRASIGVTAGDGEIAALAVASDGDLVVTATRGGIGRRYIPVAAHLPGWESDLHLGNVSSEMQNVELIYRSSVGEERRLLLTLAAGESLLLADVVGSSFSTRDSIGSIEVVAGAGVISGAIARHTGAGGRTAAGVDVRARRVANAHLSVPAREWIESLTLAAALRTGEMAEFVAMRRPYSYSNFGFAEVTGEPVELRIEIVSGRGDVIEEFAVMVGAFRSGQVSSRGLSRFGEAAMVRIRIVSGKGAVMLYRSIVDEITRDSIYTPARRWN